MRFLAILNREGGTLRTTDLDAFAARSRETLEAAGHTVEFKFVKGKQIMPAIHAAVARDDIDVVMAGGGDGTISAAAGALADHETKALAILPAGTMNLFARSLGIPLDLDAAIKAFATGETRRVDMAEANGQPFVHQFSLGMHAKLVANRAKMTYKSRLGKMRASARAALDAVLNPPNVHATLDIDGEVMTVRSTGIGISNNLFGEGHLPYADKPDDGQLGVYVSKARVRHEMILFSLNMALGRWERNEHVDIWPAKTVTLTVRNHRGTRHCVVDGELQRLEQVTRITVRPGRLSVLVPAAPGDADGKTS